MPALKPRKARRSVKGTAKRRTKKRSTVSTTTNGEREVIYPKFEGKVGWLTAEQARGLLLWKQSTGEKPYKDYLLKDRDGVPTRCYNVDRQRPFYQSTVIQCMHEILNGHWNGDGGETNGESIIIGKTGLVLDGKHRLVALVFAAQEWLNNPDKYPYWSEEPKIHCAINFGVREDMVAINTMNTGKTRSLADAIFACGLFDDLDISKNKNRATVKKLARMADYAVRLLWQRTGAKRDAFSPRRTHAESLDFINRHPKILECVRHIHEENSDSEARLKYYPSLGYAAALLYLMGSSKTERENDDNTGYIQLDTPSESLLDWSMWDKACDFWTLLANGDKRFDLLRQKVSELVDSEGGSFIDERIALIIKAWWCFAKNKRITEKSLEYDTVEDGDGVRRIVEYPMVGEVFGEVCGIDLGKTN